MSRSRAYHLVLYLLPAGLREKHGPAMETLFASELERARERGWLREVLTGAAGMCDVVRRSAYEWGRARYSATNEHHDFGAPCMPQPTTRQLLRRHAASFVIAVVALTTSLLALFAWKQVPALSERGMSAGSIAYVLLLAVPFTAAMTIPMSVFVAVLREFTRLGAEGTLAAARQEQHGIRRLTVPVLAGAAMVAGLAFVEIAAIVPPANTRLATMLMGSGSAPSGRTMSLGELRNAERVARSRPEDVARADAAVYEVEIQKKFALPAACLVLALAGVAVALRVPRGGAGLILGASLGVLGGYYLMIITGESLALRLVVSPVIGMWGANALLLAVALLAVRRPRVRVESSGSGAVVIRG